MISDYVFIEVVRRVSENAIDSIERPGWAGAFREP